MDTPNPLAGGPPPIPADLVDYLSVIYPDRFPAKILGSDPQAISADLHRHAGRLEVVAFLRDHLARQAAKTPARPSRRSATTP